MAGNKVIVTKNKTKIINASKVGPAGPVGPSVEVLADIGDIMLEGLNNKDVLSYDAGTHKWVNEPQEDIVDGGNF